MKLTYMMFTKHLEGMDIPEIIEHSNLWGCKGPICVCARGIR